MSETPYERKLAENEVIFRNINKEVIESLVSARAEEKAAKTKTKSNKEFTLFFFCECSNDKCLDRIKLSASEYEKIHTQTNMFILIPGHEVPEIEKVTKKTKNYYVVQKYMTPPTKVDKLNPKNKLK